MESLQQNRNSRDEVGNEHEIEIQPEDDEHKWVNRFRWGTWAESVAYNLFDKHQNSRNPIP